jgi:hypothetical protein
LSSTVIDGIVEDETPWRYQIGDTTQGVVIRREKGISEMLILIIVLVLVFGLGGGYYGYGRWGIGGGAGIGLGTVLVILLVCYLLGVFR